MPILIFLIVNCSCQIQCRKASKKHHTSKNKDQSDIFTPIKYTLASRYYVRNNHKKLDYNLKTTQQKFDEIFGLATVMDPEGKPTPVNFSK